MPYRMTEWVDKCAERYVDNSRLVAVDGNLAVGKHAFATKLASYFDLQPVFDFDERLCFPTLGHKFIDLREFDSLLPPAARPYDRAALFMDPNIAPHAMLGGGVANYATKLQVEIYKQRYFHYFDAVAHLLNTGQGSTIVRPMHSDYVYYEALRRCGWITDESFEYYNKYSFCLIAGCRFFLDCFLLYCIQACLFDSRTAHTRISQVFHRHVRRSSRAAPRRLPQGSGRLRHEAHQAARHRMCPTATATATAICSVLASCDPLEALCVRIACSRGR